MVTDKRIKEYRYLEQLRKYIDNADRIFIKGEDKPFIYPKQLEIHLPSNRQVFCNAKCKHCFSNNYKKSLGRWEADVLSLLHKLKGKIPYHIYGGSYTEPLLSPFLFAYLATTKLYGNHFGIHTNGINLSNLNKTYSFFKNLNEISTDRTDYISISLDAGSGITWENLKRADNKHYWEILHSLEEMANIRERSKGNHAIRIVYLASDDTCSIEEFEFIVSYAKMLRLDSVRFSVPYGFYNLSFKKVRDHRVNVEDRLSNYIGRATKKLISQSEDERPYVFWNPPYFTDVDRFTFKTCYYGYFQITFGADGYIYPCSAVAAPTAEHLRIGKISSDIDIFNKQCWTIQNEPVDCQKDCFAHGLRCNRMGLEINEAANNNESNINW